MIELLAFDHRSSQSLNRLRSLGGRPPCRPRRPRPAMSAEARPAGVPNNRAARTVYVMRSTGAGSEPDGGSSGSHYSHTPNLSCLLLL